MRAVPTTSRSPPGTWRLLAPALVVWAAAAALIGYPGAAERVLIAVLAGAGVCAVAGLLISRSRREVGPGHAGPGHADHDGPAGRAAPVRAGRAGRALLGGVRLSVIAAAALLLICARIAGLEAARNAEPLRAAEEHGVVVVTAATLHGFPQETRTAYGDRAWVRAELRGPSGGVPVLLWLPETGPAHWGPGTGVTVEGRLDGLEPASSAAYGVQVLAVSERADDGTSAHPAETIGSMAAGLRLGLREAAAEIEGAELVPGFAVGDTAGVPDDLDTAMKASSLTHLTAVSGANCALVTGAILAVVSRLGAGRRLRVVCATVALAGFVAVVGPDASVQRAAIMATVVLLSDFGGKRANALPALGAAVLVLLVVDPWQAREPGFTLSVAATAGILLFVPALERGTRSLLRLPRVLALPVAVALAAQLACGPLLLFLQEGIPAVGVLANVLAAPAAPVGTGVGLLAMLLLPLRPELGEISVAVASWATRWVAATAEVTAALPHARWHWPEGPIGALALALCEVALLLAWALWTGRLELPGAQRPTRAHPWRRRPAPAHALRWAVAVLACGSLGTMVAVIVVSPAAERAATPRHWSVVACDIGQGDAFLLRDPAEPQEVMLVDTGDDPGLLRTCLDRFGVRRIALLVLTHDDSDHVGAIDVVLPIADSALIAPRTGEQEADGRRPVEDALDGAEVSWAIGGTGMRADGATGPDWEVLAPREGAVPASKNSASLVMRVRAGDTNVLMLGDSGEEEHLSLLASGADLSADIVKVAHHGSGDQDPAVLEASGADLGLISVGAGNGYGHPHPDLLADLRAHGIEALRTDEHGSIAVSGSPGSLRPWVEHGD